jgi:DNA topoisomerase-1
VQQGEPEPGSKQKPRRASLPRGMDGESLTLEQAIGLLSLPRIVGLHPETGEPIEAGIGRFGPYVRMGAVYASLARDDDVLALGLNRAVDVLARKLAGVRSLGAHPADKEPVLVRKGRFGPYVQHGSMVATLPRGVAMEEISLDEAVALLAEKGRKLAPRGKGKMAKGKPTKAKVAKPPKPGPAAEEAPAPSPAPGGATRKSPPAKPATGKKPVHPKAAAKKPAAPKPATARRKAG